MISPQTVDMMKSMKLSAVAAEFESQLIDSTYKDLSFEERLGLLVTAEWNRRQTNKVNLFIRNARFSAPSATVENIEYYEDSLVARSSITLFDIQDTFFRCSICMPFFKNYAHSHNSGRRGLGILGARLL